MAAQDFPQRTAYACVSYGWGFYWHQYFQKFFKGN
jgi:hypothetical protein